jgi:molybdenum cofactor cytidylyltransferase
VRIVGVLLAAGRGERFGGDKLGAPLADGTPLGVAACRHLVAALPDCVAVVRPGDEALAGLLRATGARVVECPDAALGMGHSLACAVRAARDADGWVVALADMPFVQPSTLTAVADALREGASIAAAAHRGRRGNPVGFAAVHVDALCALAGDRGARDIVDAAGSALRIVDMDDDGILRDVDRREDIDAS